MTEPRSPLDDARLDLVRMRDASLARWKAFGDQHLADSYDPANRAELADALQFLISTLDAEGRYAEALEETDHALLLVDPSGPQAGLLQAMRAAMLTVLGRHDDARLARQRAEALLPDDWGNSNRKWLTLCESVRLKLFDGPSERLPYLLQAGDGPRALDALFVLSWLVPYDAALGRARRIHPLVRQMRTLAESTGHRWRLDDVSAFELWGEVVAGTRSSARHVSTSHLAQWRAATLGLYVASNRRRVSPGARHLALIRKGQARLGSADSGPAAAWPTFHAAATGIDPDLTLLPPHGVSLDSLGSWLAAANAVALVGSPADALVWSVFLHRLRDLGIRSSVEWPAWLPRLEGLLLLRAGRRPQALRLLKEAAITAEDAGFVVEAAIARLQHAELAALVWPRDRQQWRADAQLLRRALANLGVDPLAHVHAVLSGDVEVPVRRANAGLSPQEIHVLRLFDAGKSYAGAGEALSISWQTVRVTAHNAYQKLGVSGRAEALAEARRRGLLQQDATAPDNEPTDLG